MGKGVQSLRSSSMYNIGWVVGRKVHCCEVFQHVLILDRG